MECDHLNKLSITFQQQDQCEIWWKMAKRFLNNHDFIHVNSTVAGKYNKRIQDSDHLGFPIRTILANVDLEVTSILPVNSESIALLVQEKRFKIDFKMAARAVIWGFLSERFDPFMIYKKDKRKVQGVPQSQTAALSRHQEEEETDKSKQAQTEQTYGKH